MSDGLTIVMYHYVRDLERTRYPGIKGLRTADFRAQLDYLRRTHQPVTVAEIVHCRRTGDKLPPKAVLLTFDDGYTDHYATCFPILFDAGISGAFFPPAAPVKRGELLDVNRVHFILAVADPETVGREIDAAVHAHRSGHGLATPEEYRGKWAKPNRFDTGEVIYIKRMLQVALPPALRGDIARDLFARHVSIDEAAFAGELYCTVEQLRVMQKSGMYIGSHGDSHCWLNSIDETAQRREIESSLDFLREIGSPVDDFWVMCYPYGGWDESLLRVLRERKCTLGLTTTVGTAKIDGQDPLLLPRYDTNDIPLS